MTGNDTGFYASDSLHVAIYDAMATDVPGGDDIAFFRSLAEQTGGPVLDGCGTGRVAIPLAEGGFDVTGIDRSAAMLAHRRGEIAPSRKRRPASSSSRRLQQLAGVRTDLRRLPRRCSCRCSNPKINWTLRRSPAARPEGPRDRPVRSALAPPRAAPGCRSTAAAFHQLTGGRRRATLDRSIDQVAQQFVEHGRSRSWTNWDTPVGARSRSCGCAGRSVTRCVNSWSRRDSSRSPSTATTSCPRPPTAMSESGSPGGRCVSVDADLDRRGPDRD